MTLSQALERICELESECKRLREKLYFLEYQPTIAAGFRGELLVSEAVDGAMTIFTAGCDVSIQRSGIKIEVKFSCLNNAVKHSHTKRWTWARPLGYNDTKQFDRLILVGESDLRFQNAYREKHLPYTFFDIPFDEVAALARQSGTHFNIQISTNPDTARSDAAIKLFRDYQVSFNELKVRYGFEDLPTNPTPQNHHD